MKSLILIGAISIIAFFGCSEDDIPTQNPPSSSKLTLNINGLEDLGADAVYEGWIIVPATAKTGGVSAETPISTGTFTVGASGNLSQTVFDVNPDNLSVATAFVLTIEPIQTQTQIQAQCIYWVVISLQILQIYQRIMARP